MGSMGESIDAVAEDEKGLILALRINDLTLLRNMWDAENRRWIIGDKDSMMEIVNGGEELRRNQFREFLEEKWSDFSDDDIAKIAKEIEYEGDSEELTAAKYIEHFEGMKK